MRNILIHEYFGVNLKVVWDTSHSNLPQLKTFIQRVLAEQAQAKPLPPAYSLKPHSCFSLLTYPLSLPSLRPS
jgi:hypothetical protein